MIKGTGVDIIEISRIETAINRWGDMFLNYVYTKEEIEYANKYAYPYPHYAGRFAAKEAIYKALGVRNVAWKDMNIINDKDGKPVCHFHKNGFKDQIYLSISHCKSYAVAQAIVTQKSSGS